MKKIISMIAVALIGSAALAMANGLTKHGTVRSITLPPPIVTLKAGAGMEVTRSYCSICHSLDYISTQQKFPKAKWQAEVTKMIKVFGAPISEADAKTIAAYISTAYGQGD